jgi:hypothetical protein
VTVNEGPGNESVFGETRLNRESESQDARDQSSGNAAGCDAPADQSLVSHAPGDGIVAGRHSFGATAARSALALLAAIAAWLVPGLGHLLLGRWGRALAFFAAVGGLVVTGYLLRGNVFPPHSGDPFGTLGFLADAGTGTFYYFSRWFEAAGPDVSRASGDYGTRFIAAAGVVNVLAVLDVIEISTGRRS